MTWKDGAYYTGEWSFGMPTPRGSFKFPNGDIYEGGWSQNKINGRGKYVHKSSGTIYEGEWK
jgi:hypothetical protein